MESRNTPSVDHDCFSFLPFRSAPVSYLLRLLEQSVFVYTTCRRTLLFFQVRDMRKLYFKQLLLVTTGLFLTILAVSSAYGQEAKQLYEQTCAMCHGPSGKGDGPTAQVLQPKPANLATALKGKDAAYLTKLLKEGGASVGKSPLMPSYEGILNDEQIRSLIKYVQGFAAAS
jgi:cytochrome c553